jgi:predicted permease
MAGLLHDLRFGFRTLTRSPGFALIAVAVLALGIGANAAVFTLANAFFLRPLAVENPGTLVRVYSNRHSNTAYRSYLEYRDRNATLDALTAFQMRSFGARIDAETEHVFGTIVSGNYFPMLGVSASLGRVLVPVDDRPEAPSVVVLSHAFWMRRFAASREVIGRTIALNDRPFTVVGIAAERFTGLMTPLTGDLWVPLSSIAVLRPGFDEAARLDRSSFHLIGRLKPGIGRQQAQADLDTIGRQLRRETGGDTNNDEGPAVSVYRATVLHPEISTAIGAFTGILMALVALVLLIVCVNVANLTLARAAGRETELAVRQSLGASRGRLVRQLLVESLLLSAAGVCAGLALASWATRAIMAVELPTPVPIALDLSLDVRVLAFTALAAIAATLGFGMMPALTASRLDLVGALKGSSGNVQRHGRLRTMFLIAQVAMSVLLLTTAALFIQSFRNAQSIALGFEPRQVTIATVDLDTRGYTPARGQLILQALSRRLESMPGVEAATLVDNVPVTLSSSTIGVVPEGQAVAPEPAGQAPLIFTNGIGPGHFATLRIPVIDGRDFTYADDDRGPRVAIVNETLARRFWPGQRAVGQRLRRDNAERDTLEVVGVVADSKYVSVGEQPKSFVYQPLAQAFAPRVTVMVRSADRPASVVAGIRQEVRAIDPGLAVFNVSPLTDAIAVSLLPVRFAGNLLGALGALALLLAAIGIYGVLSFIVRARTREIGVRLAIGAPPGAVAAMVIRQAMAWTAAGVVIGVGLALALTRFLEAFLYNISGTDPWTLAGVTLALAAVAALAASLPAVRASRTDPLKALRAI